MEVRQAIPLSTRGLFIIAQERERERERDPRRARKFDALVLPGLGCSQKRLIIISVSYEERLGCNSLFASLYRL